MFQAERAASPMSRSYAGPTHGRAGGQTELEADRAGRGVGDELRWSELGWEVTSCIAF